ncbi:MAG TPA: permease-like cell division protein FtsX [Actinomycetota bacterium]|nr:permease-like cell division protein FtsX [Actinomycetota bacterium]
MRLNYFLSETAVNLKRNLLMTIAAISTVAISLLLLGGAQILQLVVANVTSTWEGKVEVSVFLRNDVTEGELDGLRSDLAEMPEIETFTYVSKNQAYEEFKKLYADKPELWQVLPKDSLPASFRVSLVDASDAEEVAARVEGSPGIDDVNFGGDIIRRLLQVNTLLRAVTLGMSAVLMVAAAALIANTIRLAIFARREEISIMKLVGATNWFIRIPFMFEGVFAALTGAIVSSIVLLGANELFFSKMGDFLAFLGPVFSFSAWEIAKVLLILVGGGVAVGLFGSALALRRFLEV